ncbi:MAG: ABC transporter permease [Lachnospiraceae bacterium]|nr:ABC transporter permease [Lachnospiraceae bacterium]MDE6185847.1 ABC transporter permease [Lachnospiraceae bacterium]MDE7285750.1 ABC transporter permease [Lachnospiraceae bacterium]
MKEYIFKRLIMTVFVVISAAFLIFTIMYFIPGDPARLILGADATAAQVEAKREMLGLNQPYLVRLGSFLSNVFLHFDLGTSWVTNTSIVSGLESRFPRTFLLGTLCVLTSTVIGLPIGITSAVHHHKWQDKSFMVMAMTCISMPDFWLAMMLTLVFSLKLNLLPSFGIGSWKCYVLPVISGSVQGIGSLARQTRSSMLEVYRSDYVTTARAKGVPEGRVIRKHMLANALIPIITTIGGLFGSAICGTIVIEQVFSMPGIGTYLSTAINARDYPVLQGSVIVMAVLIAVIMLIVDLVYAWVDPRIKAQYVAQNKKCGRRRKKNG